jgi:hypothetical protein
MQLLYLSQTHTQSNIERQTTATTSNGAVIMNLNRIAFFVGALMLLLQDSALAEPPAGIVLYFQTEGEVYILLAEHADSKRG